MLACLYKDMPLVLVVNGCAPLQDAGIFNYLSLSDIRAIHLYSIDRKKFFGTYVYPWSYEQHSSIAILKLTLHLMLILVIYYILLALKGK